jgi:hypothetical protein
MVMSAGFGASIGVETALKGFLIVVGTWLLVGENLSFEQNFTSEFGAFWL